MFCFAILPAFFMFAGSLFSGVASAS